MSLHTLWLGIEYKGCHGRNRKTMAKTRRNYHFQYYDNADPEWSGSFGFNDRFGLWHTGILVDMEEGKVRTEGMNRTLGLTTRLFRSALADLPPGHYLKVFQNMEDSRGRNFGSCPRQPRSTEAQTSTSSSSPEKKRIGKRLSNRRCIASGPMYEAAMIRFGRTPSRCS